MVTGSGTTANLLRKRFRSELEMVRGLVQKARLLVAVNGGAVVTGRAGAKRRKTSPLVVVEVIEPRMSRDEREHLAGSLSSLSLDLPPHIVEFMQRQCSAVLDGGEMEINLHSAGDASLFQLKKLLDEFAVERKQRLEAETEPPKDEAVAASGAMSTDEENEFVDICADASPVVLDKKLPETGGDSPSSSSSLSSSSGSSCSGESSDSDSDSDESTGSSPHPADLPMEDAAAAAAAAEPLEVQIDDVQEVKLDRAAAPAPAGRIGDLIEKAQEEKRRFLREVERKRAREELQEMERTATPGDSIHPADMVKLHIAEVEHVVSSGNKTSPVRLLGLVME